MKILILLGFFAFLVRRSLTYLHIFQQEEYDSSRFLKWLVQWGHFDRRATAALAAVALLDTLIRPPRLISYVLAFLSLVAVACLEVDPRYVGKKRLVLTARAKRLLISGVMVALTLEVALIGLTNSIWPSIIGIHLVPFALIMGNWLLGPYERITQRRYWREAHAKLESIHPIVIGVTGSFGKTSVKHILGHVLDMQAPTFITSGSVNTAMGIARAIRERLSKEHRYFVCEMGAYGPGSIERLTKLAPPDIGVITAIGHAHYERFKSLETVAETKFELAEAVSARAGSIVTTEDVLQYRAAADFIAGHSDTAVVVGSCNRCSLKVVSVRQDRDGILVQIVWEGTNYELKARLYGGHQAINMAITFAVACKLGVPPRNAALALESVPQISHRLEVIRQPSGWIKIDDAYNSNPIGFASALDILDLLCEGEGRRILVTPGMVELGAAHTEQHAIIGRRAGGCVDILLAILPERLSPLIVAYRETNPAGQVIEFSAFSEASGWLDSNVRSGDVVLLENDLPDLYETRISL